MVMRLETMVLLRQCLHNVTLNVGAPDFQESATNVLGAYADLEESIKQATSEPWPGMELPYAEKPRPPVFNNLIESDGVL